MDAVSPPFDPPVPALRRRALCIGLLLTAGTALGQTDKKGWIVRPWPKDRKPPQLRLRTLDGEAWSLAAVRGRVVLLNFWATWCEPCRAEMPALQSLARRYEPDGLQAVAINYREGEPAIRRFLQHTPLALPILLDSDGEAASAWTPKIFPSTVVIGRDGRPAFTVIGEADWSGDEMQALITPLLRSGTGASANPARRRSP